MVRRHLTIPHKFIELTEHELPRGLEGWWYKLPLLDLFNDEVLYLDLDVVISKNIDHLVEIGRTDQSRLWARDDFSYSRVNPRQGLSADFLVTLGGPGTINSSVMYWKGRRKIPRLPGAHGDQNCVTHALWPDGIGLFPNDSIKSWKYHAMRGEGYGDICVFHGEPKPHQREHDEFVRTHWR